MLASILGTHAPGRRTIFVLGLCVLTAGLGFQLYQRGLLRFSYPSATETPVRGIDVSHHQGVIDWNEVARQNIRFTFIKATEGADWHDPMFGRNWQGAANAGIATGTYHYFTLCTPGAVQAEHFIATVPRGTLPPVVDLEYAGNCARRPERGAFLRELWAFNLALERHYARAPVLYTTREFYDAYLNGGLPPNARLWVRDLFGAPSWPSGRTALFHQYANRGRVSGIAGPVDLNVFLGSEAEFERLLAE